MKIGFCLPLNPHWVAGIDRLSHGFPGVELVADPDRSLAEFSTLDAVVANPVPREKYEAASRLRAVFVPFVGINHLPSDLLLERGVEVYNCHGNAFSVAERALAMTLAAFGRVIEFHNDLRAGRWHGFWVGKGHEDFWHSLQGRSCAVLGMGAIGSAIARLLKAFDCPVTGYRRGHLSETPPYFDRVARDAADAVRDAEVVFVALPLTAETEGLVSRELLAGMKGKFLVNVGRGAIVDEEGLYRSLADGILAGAAIDTWYTYPSKGCETGAPSRFPIHELPNVVLSPHVAGATWEAVRNNAVQTL
ncbi:MAG TPA: 2-hydroxyacid dehydrogenase, partial [Magnetospirillaceae bacterium]|nr:2-hydroxyacid dehydrogenase [Magnetospirillaceae bacterium]